MKQISFIVTVQNRPYDKIGNIMSKMDLGISGISAPEKIEVSFTTKSKVDRKYMTKMKKAVKHAIESSYTDYRVLNVEPEKLKDNNQ